jgi:hypothetical protein
LRLRNTFFFYNFPTKQSNFPNKKNQNNLTFPILKFPMSSFPYQPKTFVFENFLLVFLLIIYMIHISLTFRSCVKSRYYIQNHTKLMRTTSTESWDWLYDFTPFQHKQFFIFIMKLLSHECNKNIFAFPYPYYEQKQQNSVPTSLFSNCDKRKNLIKVWK